MAFFMLLKPFLLVSKNRINISYKMSTSDSEKIIPKFSNKINNNENVKKLQKAK